MTLICPMRLKGQSTSGASGTRVSRFIAPGFRCVTPCCLELPQRGAS